MGVGVWVAEACGVGVIVAVGVIVDVGVKVAVAVAVGGWGMLTDATTRSTQNGKGGRLPCIGWFTP